MQERINLHIENQVARVALNRPGKHNALDMEMFRSIASVQKILHKNRELRAVILSGEGVDFCSGLDVKALMKDRAGMMRLLWKWLPWQSNLAQEVSTGWRKLPVPVIAALHGRCWGGGFQIALGADFRIVHPNASLSIMESKWGLIPDMAISTTLRDILPPDRVKELAWSGRVFDAQEALHLGLVTGIEDQPLEAARELAAAISTRSPMGWP